MPSVLSKILMPEWNVPYNCYELGHTWTPYCTEAALEIGLIVFQESLKLYAPLYLVNQALQRKFDRKSFSESTRSIIRSSIFLGLNAFLVIFFFCLSRQIFGRFYYTLCAYLPSFFGSLLAIQIERPSRRKALAFYVANIASETLYRILVSRGYIQPLPRGQLLLFTGAITSLIFLYETGNLQDPLLKFVFNLLMSRNSKNINTNPPNDEKNLTGLWNRLKTSCDQLWYKLKNNISILSYRNIHCVHHPLDVSCFESLFLYSFLKPFLLGYTAQVAWRTIPKLLSGRFDHLNREILFSHKSTSFAMFLATFASIYNMARCGLCHVSGSNQKWHSIVSALLASPSITLAPSTSLTLYLVWKCAEAFFNLASRNGYIRYDRVLVPLLYAFATSQLFYAAVLDPSHIKPSYKRFLDRVTSDRLKYINRNVLEVFGTKASLGYESFLPIYDLAHTTRRFQESVLVWLL